MTARYFLDQVPEISKKQAKALKEAIGRIFPDPNSNAQSDKIRQVAFIPEVPKNFSGKILRRVLKGG